MWNRPWLGLRVTGTPHSKSVFPQGQGPGFPQKRHHDTTLHLAPRTPTSLPPFPGDQCH